MKFDWITWGIWLIGFIILVCWIIVPIKEFRQLLKDRKTTKEQ